MNREDGTPTNAVYGFCTMINKLINQTDADLVAVIFDKQDAISETKYIPLTRQIAMMHLKI